MNAKEIFEVEIAGKLKDEPEKAATVGAVIGFEITGDGGGYWTIDCPNKGIVTSGQTKEAAMTVTLSADDLIGLYTKKLSPMALFLAGKIKVKGDMSLALKLSQII